MAGFNVVICGGGIAGVEALLRLRRLAGDHVEVTLVNPEDDFVCRPLAVLAPFEQRPPSRYPLERIAADTDATWVKDRLVGVDVDASIVHTARGEELPFDAMLLSLGARESSPFEHARVFSDRDADRFATTVRAVAAGQIGRLAFVLPDWPVWPVPLYELALLTAAHARGAGRELEITFVTPEPRPLKAFGQAAGEAIAGLMAQAGISLYTGTVPRVPSAQRVTFEGTELIVDEVITVPRVSGPAVHGLPAGTGWFVPIDGRCVVRDTGGRVFAAGDVTDFPVKHGAIGAVQADTAAAGIAHLAGVGERPAMFERMIRTVLLTGDGRLYLVAEVVEGIGWQSSLYSSPPWSAEHKVVAEELGPYLSMLDARAD